LKSPPWQQQQQWKDKVLEPGSEKKELPESRTHDRTRGCCQVNEGSGGRFLHRQQHSDASRQSEHDGHGARECAERGVGDLRVRTVSWLVASEIRSVARRKRRRVRELDRHAIVVAGGVIVRSHRIVVRRWLYSTANTGLASSGLASSGLASSGLASSALRSTGHAVVVVREGERNALVHLLPEVRLGDTAAVWGCVVVDNQLRWKFPTS
jgi:hypothetical protein